MCPLWPPNIRYGDDTSRLGELRRRDPAITSDCTMLNEAPTHHGSIIARSCPRHGQATTTGQEFHAPSLFWVGERRHKGRSGSTTYEQISCLDGVDLPGPHRDLKTVDPGFRAAVHMSSIPRIRWIPHWTCEVQDAERKSAYRDSCAAFCRSLLERLPMYIPRRLSLRVGHKTRPAHTIDR